jgi:2-keto-4-pentenoate hydratase/2-oxohepta-3-ene-1,7-dioic acid hydratase in catechol pathway
MKFVKFKKDNYVKYGIVEGNSVKETSGNIFSDYTVLDKAHTLKDITILPPSTPSKIIAIGLNYRSHAEELKMKLPEEPLIFMKPSTSVIGHGENIIYPSMSRQIDYEGELGVVIGKKCRFVSPDDSRMYILGYTCFNDVTARDLQKKDGQFTRSKGFDSFAPMGPFIETDLDPENVNIETFLNGEKKQAGSTRDLIFPVNYLVSFISRIMTLYPGDIIATGTPGGIGPMRVGDTVEVRIEGIGILKNTVVQEQTRRGKACLALILNVIGFIVSK